MATVTLAAYANPNRPARFLGPQEFISNGISISLAIFVTARRYASAVLAVVVCLSVCLCVCPSQAGIVSKRLHVGSRKQRHTIAQGL